jgi:hypothetical protein
MDERNVNVVEVGRWGKGGRETLRGICRLVIAEGTPPLIATAVAFSTEIAPPEQFPGVSKPLKGEGDD